MLNHLGVISRVALDFFFPPKCVACSKEGGYVCASCLPALSYTKPPVCPVCILPIGGKRRCDCRYWTSLDGLGSPFIFRGIIRQAVIQLKYNNLRAIAPLLAGYMHEYMKQQPFTPDLITAVPVHKSRLRQRGYNQAELLAKELGKLTGIPGISVLKRARKSQSQVEAGSIRRRRLNVENAFSCTDVSIKNKKVLIIDDICTTGATLDSCAGSLKLAGAVVVRGLTLAREI